MPRRTRFLLAVIAAAAAIGGRIEAQVVTTSLTREDGVAVQSAPARNGFSLFAEEDLAGTSLRLTGVMRYAFFNAGGLCSFGNTAGDIFNSSCGQGGGSSNYFHIASSWGAGLDAYRSIRSVHPGVANMRQPTGYSTPYRMTSVAPITTRIGPADGQFAKYFSGVTAANGEGCRDMQGAQGAGLPANFTLLASSDCPVTWAGNTWGGIRQIPDSVWIRRFNANPTAFRWDDWKISPSEIGNAPPLGDNASFGSFSDFPREVVQKYGGVTPQGFGPPQERGFPLGLEVRADAFKFDRATLRDGVFVRWLLINNSAKVWGRGIDYDSLAFGVDPGYSFGGPRPSVNNIISLGVHSAMSGNLSGRCNATTYPRRVPPGANEGCDGTNNGFPFIMFLKSPLGDLRNKMFTMKNSDGSPRYPSFYKPDHQEADDTITFNRFFQGGFGNAQVRYQGRNDRAFFGAIAGREADALDGRVTGDITAAQLWSDFLYEGTDGTNGLQNARFNKSVPSSIPGYGKWDWNDDGIPDTIKVPDCGRFGCAKPFADTIAGGFTSDNGENLGSFLGVSEFSLKAGDTTEFMFYLGYVGGRDTIPFLRAINNITEGYLKNYAGASPYPVPAISANDVQVTSASFRDSVSGAQNVNVRLQLRMAPRHDDPYLKAILARIQSAEGADLRRLNPTLVNEVTRRMQQNLAEVLIFMSCDGGTSWTSDANCAGSVEAYRTRDARGNPIGLGWRPRFILAPTDTAANNGVLSTYVVNDIVQGGREYLYSVVTKTRSLGDIEVLLSATFDAAGNITTWKTGTLEDALTVDIDSVVTPLRTSGSSTVVVYAPLSVPAGTIFARFDSSTVQGNATNRVAINTTSSAVSGRFRMRFGNRFIVQRSVNTVNNATTTMVVRQSVYARGSMAGSAGAVNFVAAADTFVGTGPLTYSTGGSGLNIQNLSTTPRANLSAAQTQVFLDTISKAGYVVVGENGEPLYLAVGNTFAGGGSLGIAQSTVSFEGAPNNPGFTATVNDEADAPAARVATVVRATGDTLNSTVTNANGVVYQSTGSQLFNMSANQFKVGGYTPGGIWKLAWSSDAFGPLAPFAWGVPDQLQSALNASLEARTVARTTLIGEGLRSLPNFPGGALGNRPIIPAKLPFTIVGTDGQPADAVFLQRHATGNPVDSVLRNSILLGSNGDTARVTVPPDVWMPGDTLYIIEQMLVDSTAVIAGNTVTVHGDTVVNGRAQRLPIQVRRPTLTLRLRMACNSNVTSARNTCNPLRLGEIGASGYLPFASGHTSVFHLNRQFDQNSEVLLTGVPVRANARPLTKTDMARIHAVPNPYVVQSDFDAIGLNRERVDARIRFVNVPDEGMMRIYSISGQLVQQLSWTPQDLIASGDGSPHGDLPYNLRNMNGLDIVSGLYMFVLTPRGPNANGMIARGKFVVIR